MTGTVKVTASDYSTFTAVDFTNGQQINMNGGESILRNFVIENTGSQYPINGIVKFEVSKAGLKNGDCKIWLRDSNNAELGEDTTVEAEKLSLSTTFTDIAPQASKQGKFEVQCNPDFNEILTFTLTMEPVSQFTFKE